MTFLDFSGVQALAEMLTNSFLVMEKENNKYGDLNLVKFTHDTNSQQYIVNVYPVDAAEPSNVPLPEIISEHGNWSSPGYFTDNVTLNNIPNTLWVIDKTESSSFSNGDSVIRTFQNCHLNDDPETLNTLINNLSEKNLHLTIYDLTFATGNKLLIYKNLTKALVLFKRNVIVDSGYNSAYVINEIDLNTNSINKYYTNYSNDSGGGS